MAELSQRVQTLEAEAEEAAVLAVKARKDAERARRLAEEARQAAEEKARAEEEARKKAEEVITNLFNINTLTHKIF